MSEHEKVVRKHGWVKGKPSNEGTSYAHPDLRHHEITVFGKGHWQHDKVFPNDKPAVAMTIKHGNNHRDLGRYLTSFHKNLNVTEETPAGNCMGASSDTSGPVQGYSPLLGGVPSKTKKKKRLKDILLKRKSP